MSVAKELTKAQRDKVEALLRQKSKYRDSDRALLARVWIDTLGGEDKIAEISVRDFLLEYIKDESKLETSESIGRARRKLQRDNPSLRGDRWEERHKEEIKIIKQLNN